MFKAQHDSEQPKLSYPITKTKRKTDSRIDQVQFSKTTTEESCYSDYPL
jgi:hypothetical protein